MTKKFMGWPVKNKQYHGKVIETWYDENAYSSPYCAFVMGHGQFWGRTAADALSKAKASIDKK